MEKKKANIGTAAAGAGKAAAGFFDKAKKAVVSAVDQNDDGKLGLDDISLVKDSVKAAVKDSSEKWNEKQEQKKRDKELEALRPIFEADVEKPEFSLPKLIRVAEMDEKHAKSELCRDSIGYIFTGKDMDIMTIYPDKIADFHLRFYPDADNEVYYVDPADRDYYIALEKYYDYLKIARVGELQKIAQDLGAKHFSVIYKETSRTSSSNDVGIKGKGKVGKQGGNVDAEQHVKSNTYSKTEIAAEMICIGHDPVGPKLVYFQKDPQIRNLISLRMADNTITHQSYVLHLSESSGIKEKDALKIDASLSAMKANVGFSVAKEAHSETSRVFEYVIDFDPPQEKQLQ